LVCREYRQQGPLVHNRLAHIDLKTGQRSERMLDPGDAAGEPVFVPRSAGFHGNFVAATA
jgi:carotenoid cleavage dioxygenase-like enzyme